MDVVHSVVIIGSGPAGWTASVYVARAGLSPLVFSGEKSGGQLMLTTEVENFPGFPKGIVGPELMTSMREQALRFGTVVLDSNVTQVDFTTRPFRVWSEDKEFQAKSIVIATGAESIWLNVPGELQFIGRGVSTCAVCDAAFFKGKTTYVIGGGDAAMEDVLALTKFAASVTLVHRRSELRASKIMQDRVLNNPKVKVLWNTQVKEIKGDVKVTTLVVEDVTSQAVQELPADGVFVAIGHKPTTDIFSGQIQLDEKQFIVTRLGLAKPSLALAESAVSQEGFVSYPTMTSIEGVFAAGDVVDFRYKQAITAAGFGCMAALDAERYLESL